MNRFITEKEVEEAKQKRDEEWRKARESGRELPKEEEELQDFRCLYEKLKEQKDKKQEEFEDKLKFKNMIYKGLNQEDAQFLATVAEKQAELDGKRYEDESGEIAEYKAAVEKVWEEEKTENKNVLKSKLPSEYMVKRKSQAHLVASAIIRKRKSSSNAAEGTAEKHSKSEDVSREGKEHKVSSSLSLLADYPSSSSDEDTT